ncbi:hypothetical protein BB559_006436 [Furculomyces boomerangus]|uniref:Vacuolar protein sorting-associated protein 45 n=1 Tax=Furculomyces boomerangus TaxID=61424 RepID=A0A2T9Y2Y7_9FUNG|nr:hypothetical protein BB559_006436 [Furculomyces boomerangus]
MDLLESIKYYIERMVTEVKGMKILLLDEETTGILSVASTQSFLLSKETFLVDKLENNKREKMKQLKCIVFIRPTESSITSLVQELLEPKYSEYYIYFSNTIKKSVIETLAEHDEYEVVREIKEFYADYYAILPNFFSLGMTSTNYPLFMNRDTWNSEALTRCVQGLMSLFLSSKLVPSMIKYEGNSRMGFQLAKELDYQINVESGLFNYYKNNGEKNTSKKKGDSDKGKKAVLVILDRKNDPLTPLLKQWTYQAMIHEIFGINNGRVDLSASTDIREEYKEIVLSVDQDEFFKNSIHLNFGDLGIKIKDYVNNFEKQHKSTKDKLSSQESGSIEEMKKYETLQPSSIHQLVEALKNIPGLSQQIDDMITTVQVLLEFGGEKYRQGDLFQNKNILSRGKSVIRGLKGVENVYTQHKSNYVDTVSKLIKNQFRTKNDHLLLNFPTTFQSKSEAEVLDGDVVVVVFFVGGVTFAEENDSHKIVQTVDSTISSISSPQAGINTKRNVSVIVGGTNLLNSTTFLDNLKNTFFP